MPATIRVKTANRELEDFDAAPAYKNAGNGSSNLAQH
jgi:hypothetical protein